jgi:phenylpropionate dioxygenase-like ring-hydroxylating dioxygenase large terminal subunit
MANAFSNALPPQVFLRNCWYVAAFANELDNAFLARRILNQPVVFFRASNGDIAALEDRCPHRLVPLSIGTRVGDALQCGYHGTVVGADGSCLAIPGQKNIPTAAATRTYPAVERHALIWIWMGAPELADPALVPDLRWLDHPEWTSATGYMQFEADYRLVTDNLLDLSHESYIHLSSLGNREEETIANFRAAVTIEDGRVFCRRDMSNIEPPPFFAASVGPGERIDRLQIASYTPPGINMTEAGSRPVGTSEYNLLARVMHLLTPETDRSTHYFFTLSRNYLLDDIALTEAVASGTYETFGEDKFVLELQQKALIEQGTDQVPRMTIALDAGPIQGRRLLSAAIEREQADPSFVASPVPLVRELEKVPRFPELAFAGRR